MVTGTNCTSWPALNPPSAVEAWRWMEEEDTLENCVFVRVDYVGHAVLIYTVHVTDATRLRDSR
jgi:hypothetical protein